MFARNFSRTFSWKHKNSSSPSKVRGVSRAKDPLGLTSECVQKLYQRWKVDKHLLKATRTSPGCAEMQLGKQKISFYIIFLQIITSICEACDWEKPAWIPQEQWCLTNLIAFNDETACLVDGEWGVDIVYLSFSKAFNSISCGIFLEKTDAWWPR